MHHILSVLVEDKPGVLARIASLLARRGSTSTRSRWADRRRRHVPNDHRGRRPELEQVKKQLPS